MKPARPNRRGPAARSSAAPPARSDPSGPAPEAWLAWLALLGDPARVRLLRLLSIEELGVGELSRIVQLPQSTVSRHLKTLLDGEWILRRAEGTTSLYRLATSLPQPALELWSLTRARFDAAPAVLDDDHRLAVVLAERSADAKAFFGRIGGEWSTVRRELFGDRFNDEALLSLLSPDLVVADLGCGTGEAAERLAPLVRRVIAVDREPAMLAAARKRLAAYANVEFRQGDLLELPLGTGEVDAAVMALVLHHAAAPKEAIAEAGRALRTGGGLLIVDMVAHDRESWRHTMGHRHLGFAEGEIEQWNGAGGMKLRRVRRLRPESTAKGPGLFAALMQRSA